MSDQTEFGRRRTAQDLRAWAEGIYTIEAAVELLIRCYGGRFASPGQSWIVAPGEDRRGNMRQGQWLDVDQLTEETTAVLSGGERRLLGIVASLAGGERVDLSDAVSGLDRETFDLVLAALAHANGSHDYREPVINREVGTFHPGEVQPSLHPWPEQEERQ